MPSKYKRTVIGSVIKSREAGKPDYIKISNDVALTKGQYLNLESKTQQLKGVEQAVADGKLSSENAEAAKERINKIPDFVRFQVVAVQKNQ